MDSTGVEPDSVASKELLGQVLAAKPDLRGRMVLATKGGHHGHPPPTTRVPPISDRRSRHLGSGWGWTPSICIRFHRPDLFGHPAEVADVLGAMVDEGVIGQVGVSNYTPAQTRALIAHLGVDLVSTQPEYSVANLDPLRDGTFDLCMEVGMTPADLEPTGRRAGVATGEDLPPELVTTLDRLAEREGTNRATIALAFVLAHPCKPVAIIGTQNPDRIAESTDAFKVNLDRNDVYDIVEASEGVPLP